MSLDESPMIEARRQGTRAVAGRAECLGDEVLARAARGQLGVLERRRVADHLAGCADCAEELQLLEPLAAFAARSAAALGGAPAGAADHRRSWLPVWQLATLLLLLASGALVAWNLGLQRDNRALATRVATATEPAPVVPPTAAPQVVAQVNVPIIDLHADALRSGDGARDVVAIPGEAALVTLILTSDSRDTAAKYHLDMADASGRSVWSSDAMRLTPYGTFTVAIQPRAFAPGVYRLSLSTLSGAGRQPLETYALRLDPPR